jgi:predicted MPP superfamily phosphohydrolase
MSKRKLRLGLLMLVLLGLAGFAWGYSTATRDPVVRSATVAFPNWPQGAPPLTAVLISDIHVIAPDMPPKRVERIVGQIDALKPDIVFIAGDFVSDRTLATRHYPASALVAPLSKLRPMLGTFAVLGNHDHWRDPAEVRRALHQAGIRVLNNNAAQAGPLVVGGLDDSFTDHAKLWPTLKRMRRLAGPRILVSHTPDPFAWVPGDVPLMLAGHTHCGQVSLPLVGPLMTASVYGRRFACGLIRQGGKTLIVTAGLGASNLPIRIGAVPDLWLLTLGGGPPQRER